MIAVVLSLASALGNGGADFAGGLASRDTHVLRVVAVAAPAGLAVYALLLPVFGVSWSTSAVLWGGAAGLDSAVGFALLYRTLALGPMSLLSPLTAVISAAIPVAVGIIEGERIGIVAILGLPVAALAIVLVGGAPGSESGRPSLRALVLAAGAGLAISGQLIFLHEAPRDSGLAPLVAMSTVSSFALLGAYLVMRRQLDGQPPKLRLSVSAGVLGALASLAFLFAVRLGDLSVVAVITAMYPVGTLVLARFVLGERVHRLQLVGLVAAALAVAMLALGNVAGP